MKTRYKILILIACVCVVFGICGAVVIRSVFFHRSDTPNAYYTRGEAEYLLEQLRQEGVVFEENPDDTDGFTVGDAKETLRVLLHMDEEQIQETSKLQYEAAEGALRCLYKAKDSQVLGEEDFRGFYEYLQNEVEGSKVQTVNVMLLDMAETDTEDGEIAPMLITLDQNYILSGYGDVRQQWMQEELDDAVDQCVRLYVSENRVLDYVGISTESVVLSNVWMESYGSTKIQVFLNGYHKTYACNLSEDDEQNQIEPCLVDIRIGAQGVTDLVLKSDTITAKVLSVTEDGVELEGYGILGLSEYYRIYKIYGELAVEPTSHILVGYNTTNFVVADGVIEAALITEPIRAENIRVVLQNSGYTSLIHDVVTITSDSSFTLKFQNQEKHFEAGEVLELTDSCGYMADGRVVIASDAENGKLQVTSITRNGIHPSYRGTLEIAPYGSSGLTIVNELSLEEYLYTVVPSEMPTSYGDVALQVQAICARGYAYMKMQDGTYAKYGAHVDDSTMTQVYNAVEETEAAILAVKETYGMVPVYDGSVIQAYFFSTSCGTTCTNADVWDGEALPYLLDTLEGVGTSEEGRSQEDAVLQPEAVDFSDEAAFRAFIDDSSGYQTYESDYSLYRWSITYTQEDMSNAVNGVLSSRYEANPDKILTLQADGSYQSQPIESVGEIQQIQVTERGKSGIVKELQIVGSQAAILVRGQSNARALMSPSDVIIRRQDGTESSGWTLLPSPFYYITVTEEGSFVIQGGGFGHGVGMSQNGTKALADLGYSPDMIIQHYYSGVELVNIYQ